MWLVLALVVGNLIGWALWARTRATLGVVVARTEFQRMLVGRVLSLHYGCGCRLRADRQQWRRWADAVFAEDLSVDSVEAHLRALAGGEADR